MKKYTNDNPIKEHYENLWRNRVKLMKKKEMKDRDDTILRYLYKQGFRISAQELDETRLDKHDSKITIVVRK